jgi:hypothetical protein
MAYAPMIGGEDLVSSALAVPPGTAQLTYNYEQDVGGRFRRIDGYEAFDGRPKPSEASYWLLNFDAGTAAIAVGNTITGFSSTKTGEVLSITLTSGSWAGGNAAGQMVLFNVTGVGTFTNNEELKVGGVTKALANGVETEQGYSDETTGEIALLAAMAATRADILAVPGSGNILGVWQYKGVKYAFRNNAGGTAVAMYKSSTTGWTLCDLGERLGFNTGTVAFVEGETITKGAASAVIRRVVLTSGTWAGGNAAGYFSISGRAGGDFGAGAATGSILGAASVTGIQTAYSFAVPGGRFSFVNSNFGGHSSTQRMYGCDGKNKAFEWDGTYFTTITTGMTTDTPIKIIEHKKHLFLMFSGGSLQHSSIGVPFTWSAITGATELGLGDEGIDFLSMPDALVVFTRNTTKVLYGKSSADWELKPYADDSGCIEWTLQGLGSGIYLDDRGLTSLSTTQVYGDFKTNTISKLIEPYLRTRLSLAQSSIRVKEKNQYRLFFTNLEVLALTAEGNKILGFTRQRYNHLPVCTCSSENLAGEEELFFGSTDGFVYQLDSGYTFNGSAIDSLVKLNYNHLKSPSVKKRIRRIIVDSDVKKNTYLQVSAEFDHGESAIPLTILPNLSAAGGIWDEGIWDDFDWDGTASGISQIDVDGTASSFSLTIFNSGVFELQEAEAVPRTGITNVEPHTLQGYTVHYDIRGVQR